jgi:hypothetical protein
VSTQPGVAADQARIGDLEVRAASIVGPSHRCEEPATPRQDAYRIGRDTRGHHLIVAVADGMSDSAHADHGATVAVSIAVRLVRDHLDQGRSLERLSAPVLLTQIAGQVNRTAEERGWSADDARTGLLVGVITVRPDDAGRRLTWFGHLADLSAWLLVRDADGPAWRQIAGDSKSDGLDANSLHGFLPFHPHLARQTLGQLKPGDVLAFLSDGVSDAWTKIPEAGRRFARDWATPPPLASFLLNVGYEARGFQDDRTAVVVWCDACVGMDPARLP